MAYDLILLAEDDPEHAALARRAFTKYSIINPIFTVASGAEVLSYLMGEGRFADRREYPRPGLLLLDLKLPGMHGFEVIRWIRAHPEYKSLPIVVITAQNNSREVNEAFLLGANSFMIKPVEFADFVQATAGLESYWAWTDKAPQVPVLSWQRSDPPSG
jgi:two-component system, response regulator